MAHAPGGQVEVTITMRITALTPGWRAVRAVRGARAPLTSMRMASDDAKGRAPGAPQETRSWKERADEKQADMRDPFPLPFSRDTDAMQRARDVNLASEGQRVEGIAVPTRVAGRTDEDESTKRARLQYQCRKSGTLETDLILSTFATEELSKLSEAELDELDRLLDEPDWDIFYWCTERKPVPPEWAETFATDGRLGHRLRVHTRNDARTVRIFPQLRDDIKSPA